MSDTSRMIEDSVTRLFTELFTQTELARFDRLGPSAAAWQACADLGLDRALLSEEDGGIGAMPSDVFSIAHAAGYHAAGVGAVDALMAGWLLARAGITPPSGPGVLIDASSSAQPLRFDRGDDRPVTISGEVKVCWAGGAEWGVAAQSRGDVCEVYLVGLTTADGVSKETWLNMAREPGARLKFANTTVLATGRLIPINSINPVRLAGALARSAQISGALQRVLNLTIQYAGQRVQFGKQLGQNQVIQHMLATLAGHVAASRVAALAAWSGSADSSFDIAVAKARCSEAAGLATSVAHQVHGAIGFTHDHTLSFYTRRLWSWRAEFGSDAWWSAELGRQAIAAGKTRFWASLVSRQWPAYL
jgi:acyl-CoA dehydrogenase